MISAICEKHLSSHSKGNKYINVTASTEAVTVTYNNCQKESVSYAGDGSNMSNTIEYSDGSGTIEFMADDNKAYWYDSVENASGGVPFSYYNE